MNAGASTYQNMMIQGAVLSHPSGDWMITLVWPPAAEVVNKSRKGAGRAPSDHSHARCTGGLGG